MYTFLWPISNKYYFNLCMIDIILLLMDVCILYISVSVFYCQHLKVPFYSILL